MAVRLVCAIGAVSLLLATVLTEIWFDAKISAGEGAVAMLISLMLLALALSDE